MHKVQQFLSKIALMLSSGAFGFFIARHISKAEVQDWKQIASDAQQTTERALNLATQRSIERASREESEE